MSDHADRIDVVELAQAVRRGWRALVACTLLGILGAVAVILWAPRRFAGAASIVVKTAPTSGATSILAKLGLGDAGPALGTPAPLETEVAILSSRALVGAVVDSLLLQADVTSPPSVTARDVLASIRLAPAFRKATYRVTQLAGAQYELASGDKRFRADAGQPATLPQGTIVLRSDTLLPSSFVLLLLDRDSCVLHELFAAERAGDGWHAGSGARWELGSLALRPAGWTSADAAGLPILPGLARHEELAAGGIDHALRITLPTTQR